MAEINSPSLLGLIGRINHATTDIRKRTSSIADVLCGGCTMKGEAGNSAPDSTDMHSQLQRILTKLEHINDNLSRTESAIGVSSGVSSQECSENEPQCAGTSPLRRY